MQKIEESAEKNSHHTFLIITHRSDQYILPSSLVFSP